MAIKILQTSDIHLGAKLSYLGEKSSVHRNQIKETFEKSADLAIEKKVDLFVVCGDLFDSPFPSKLNINFVRDQFEKLSKNDVKVALIAGNHDRLEPGSVFLSDQMKFDDSNIHIFTDFEPWVLENLNLAVYGVSISAQKSRKSPVSSLSLKADVKTKNKIALLHGSVDIGGIESDNHPIDKKSLESLSFDYIGLGDWHGMLEVIKGKSWYSGSPELINSDQKEAGNVLLIEIGTKVEITPVSVGKNRVILQKIDIAKSPNISAIQKEILQDASENTVKIVEIIGKKDIASDINFTELEDSLRSKFFYLKIKNNSHLEITKEELNNYPEELLVGRFIKILRENKKEDQEIIDEAIQYGVRMLSSVKEEK